MMEYASLKAYLRPTVLQYYIYMDLRLPTVLHITSLKLFTLSAVQIGHISNSYCELCVLNSTNKHLLL